MATRAAETAVAASNDPISKAPDLNHPESRKRRVYAAFKSGDARFDGRMYVGVSSTGVYCRTVCSAKMPKYENCTFYRTAAEAEAAGFRPCLTCRPEVAPGRALVDARSNLARRTATLLQEECASTTSMETLAGRLGYTSRHVRRTFMDEYGVTPAQYALTCRLLMAKSMLTDTQLPVAQVAEASGFGSVRRFNQAFKEKYHLTPTDLRKRRRTSRSTETITLHVGYRPPYRFDELLAFFRDRALAGVEKVGDSSYARTARVFLADGRTASGWLRVHDEPDRNRLAITLSDSLAPAVPLVLARVKRQFDVDCDPQAVAEGLASLEHTVPGSVHPGTRLPGCFDPFETSCRAVLGQQISVKAANKLAARVVEAHGIPVDTGMEGLSRAFPRPVELLALGDLEESLGVLGVIKSRSRTISQIAQLMIDGSLDLGPIADPDEQIARLLAIKGIGPWTANYIAMRALGYPDAFLETDAGVAHALPDLTPEARLKLAEPWRPWRSYAVIALWNSLAE